MSRIYRFHDVVLDTRAGRVLREGQPLFLEPRTFDVLQYLLDRPGKLVTHEDLLDRIWGAVNVTAHSLTQAISQLRLTLNDDARHPRFILTVHRKGYRFVAPVHVEEASSSGGLPAGIGPWTIPTRTVRLIGRDELIRSVTHQLEDSRLVTLTGPGGVGKTQLALEIGRRSAPLFQDGALLADMTSEGDASSVARAVSRALRISPRDGKASLESLAIALRDRHLLLIVDNCDRIVDSIATLWATITAASPRVHMLVTSQQPLRVHDEVIVRVPPLEVPPENWRPDRSDQDGWSPAIRLFVQRATATNPAFAVTGGNSRAIAEICRRLDGLPLALELAAARASVLTPTQIAERLNQRFELLTSNRQTDPPRHQTLGATLDWSIGLLPEESRQLLQRLAVFTGGWTLDAAESVVADGDSGAVVTSLSALVERSLVVADLGGAEGRYQMLETIRLYALAQLDSSGRRDDLRDRHLEFFCRFGAEVNAQLSHAPAVWLQRVREEHGNVRDALDRAASTPRNALPTSSKEGPRAFDSFSKDTTENADCVLASELGLALCCDLTGAWMVEGDDLEARDALVRALGSAPGAAPQSLARGWIALGRMHHHRGEFDDARASLQQALTFLTASGDEKSFAQWFLAYNESVAGFADRSDALAAEADRDQRVASDPAMEALRALRAGMVSGARRQHGDAIRFLSRACELLAGGGDLSLLLAARAQLPLQHYLDKNLEQSRAAFLSSLRSACEIDNSRAIAAAIEGSAYLALGRREELWCARLLGAAQRLRQISGAALPAGFDPVHQRVSAVVSEALGPGIYARERRAGAETPLADILEVLLTEGA